MSAETAVSPQELVLAYLERERETWLGAKAIAARAGGRSAEANANEQKSYRMLDALLEEYFEVTHVA